MAAAQAAVTTPQPPQSLPARAATLTPLGQRAAALTYWVNRADGAHVVTTVDTASAASN